jgi:hypothetical protein
MEDGMEIKPFATSFKESEWANSVKLSREAVELTAGGDGRNFLQDLIEWMITREL